jgi:hypothetical protein
MVLSKGKKSAALQELIKYRSAEDDVFSRISDNRGEDAREMRFQNIV